MIDVYYTIEKYVKENNRLPNLNMTKQARNRYVRKLKDLGVIEKVGKGVWKWCKHYSKQVDDGHAKEIRGHGFIFRVMIPKLYNWHKREHYLRENGIVFKHIKQGQRIMSRGHKVWLCNDALVIYFAPTTSFYAENGAISYEYAIIEAKNTIKQVEVQLKTDFKINNKYFITEVRGHYAHIKNALAKAYRQKGVNKVEIEQNGRVWALIDNSFNLHEFETIAGNGQSKDDIKVVQGFFNEIRDNPELLEDIKDIHEMRSILKEFMKITKESAEISKATAYMLQEHIKRQH